MTDQSREALNSIVDSLGQSNLIDAYITSPIDKILEEKYCLEAKKSRHKNALLTLTAKLTMYEAIHSSTCLDKEEAQTELRRVKEKKSLAYEKMDEIKSALISHAEEIPKLREELGKVISHLQKATEEVNEEALNLKNTNMEPDSCQKEIHEKEALIHELEAKIQDIEMLIEDD